MLGALVETKEWLGGFRLRQEAVAAERSRSASSCGDPSGKGRGPAPSCPLLSPSATVLVSTLA